MCLAFHTEECYTSHNYVSHSARLNACVLVRQEYSSDHSTAMSGDVSYVDAVSGRYIFGPMLKLNYPFHLRPANHAPVIMVYYYDTETGHRVFELWACEYTFLRGCLMILTSPVAYLRLRGRVAMLPACNFADDFPDITIIRPGGKPHPGIMVSETPLPKPGQKLYLSTSPEYINEGWPPLPKLRGMW